MDCPALDVAVVDASKRDHDIVVVIGHAAENARRALGPAAWCALEILAATRPAEGEGWLVHSSVRSLAMRMGVAPNTAHRALNVLRTAGLVESTQRRRKGGEFGASTYRLTVDVEVLRSQGQRGRGSDQPVEVAPSASKPLVAHKARAESGEQLVLLPSA
jgi:DNA-binding transcriptional ArsR family regulator